MASLTFKTSTTFKKYVKGKFILRNLAPTENEEIFSNLLLFSLGYLAGTSAEERATNALSGKVRFFFIRGRGDFAGEGHQ